MNTSTAGVRRRLIKVSEREFLGYGCCLITCGTHGRVPVFRNDEHAEHALRLAWDTARAAHLYVDACCIMPDHVHVLVQYADPRAQRQQFLTVWRRETAKVIDPVGIRPLWQTSLREREITTTMDHRLALDYVVQNPVRSGLAADWTKYAWNFSRFHAESPWSPSDTNGHTH